jgi:Tol biopolymer transport system component
VKLQLIGRSFLFAALCSLPLQAQGTARVNVDSNGAEANNRSSVSAVSAGGRFVAFDSWADNLVPGDTNGNWDVFVHDRLVDQTTRVSVSSAGLQGDTWSARPDLTPDGRFVAFTSNASTLVVPDINPLCDVYVHDRRTGSTERVSLSTAGAQGIGTTFRASISDDARYVSFVSEASNLVPDDKNAAYDVFVRDRVSATTERVSTDSNGNEGNDVSLVAFISGDGRFVAFESDATNLVAGDTNNARDIFVKDRTTGTTTRVSVATGGTQGNGRSDQPSCSADGRFVAFESDATNLVAGDANSARDAFVHDRATGVTTLVSVDSAGAQANGASQVPSLSAGGRWVVFESLATNLVPQDTNAASDVFIHDRMTGTTQRVSMGAAGGQGNQDSFTPFPAISSDARHVAFLSHASNLVGGDSNGLEDIFVRDLFDPPPHVYCNAKPNSCGFDPWIMADGTPNVSSSIFMISAVGARPGKSGLLMYSPSGAGSSPFSGGTLCIAPQGLKRGPVVTSIGGTPGNCDAVFDVDWNAFSAGVGGGNPAAFLLSIGQKVNVQWWGRDSVAGGSFLSDAIEYFVAP